MSYYFECANCAVRIPIDASDIGGYDERACLRCGVHGCWDCVSEEGVCRACAEEDTDVERREE